MKRPLVCVVGRPNVGKSTLFNKLINRRIAITEDIPGVTRDRLYQDCEWQNKHFILCDTGGLEPNSEDVILKKIKEQVDVAMENADVILFVVDGKLDIKIVNGKINILYFVILVDLSQTVKMLF